MSARSIQARKLARALSAQTRVPVEVTFDGRKGYLVQWGDGPTVDAMSGLITAELGTGAYPSLPASKLSAFRGTTARAFAARAAAALRTGTLAEAVRAGVAYREQHDVTPPAWSRLSAADCAAHQHIEDELDKLSYPERPDDPDDEPVIEALLAGSKSNETRCSRLWLRLSGKRKKEAGRWLTRWRSGGTRPGRSRRKSWQQLA